MRSATTSSLAGLSLGLLLLSACSSAPPGSGSSTPAPVAPIPFLLQYVGEYDGGVGTGLGQVVLHVDGTFDASIDGKTASGTYAGATTPGDASVTLWTKQGETLTASFRSGTSPEVPALPQVDVVRADGTRETLVGPWIADNEAMCDGTLGTWHDDDPDPATGLRCTCARDKVYMPSRGGCIATREGSDPPRLPVSEAARDKAGLFDGTQRVTSISLATDGRYRATIDGQTEEGAWWDAQLLGQAADSVTLACTSAQHAFGAALQSDGTLTVLFAPDQSETLKRHSQ